MGLFFFGLRFLLLGVLPCVLYVRCARVTCNETDPASSAREASVVCEARVKRTLKALDGRYDGAAVHVRKVYKGRKAVNGSRELVVATFDRAGKTGCAIEVRRGEKLILFLRQTPVANRFAVTARPVRPSKKISRKIRNVLNKEKRKSPRIKKWKNRHKEVFSDKKFQLTCSARSKSAIKFKWYKDNKLLENGKRIKIVNSVKKKRSKSVLKIKRIKSEDSGVYLCTAKNDFGNDSVNATLKVKRKGIKPKCKTEGFCFHGGTCYEIKSVGKFCQCSKEYVGRRCEEASYYNETKMDSGSRREKAIYRAVIGIGVMVAFIAIIVALLLIYYFMKRRGKQKRRFKSQRELNSDETNLPLFSPNEIEFSSICKEKVRPMAMRTELNNTCMKETALNEPAKVHNGEKNDFPDDVTRYSSYPLNANVLASKLLQQQQQQQLAICPRSRLEAVSSAEDDNDDVTESPTLLRKSSFPEEVQCVSVSLLNNADDSSTDQEPNNSGILPLTLDTNKPDYLDDDNSAALPVSPDFDDAESQVKELIDLKPSLDVDSRDSDSDDSSTVDEPNLEILHISENSLSCSDNNIPVKFQNSTEGEYCRSERLDLSVPDNTETNCSKPGKYIIAHSNQSLTDNNSSAPSTATQLLNGYRGDEWDQGEMLVQ